MSKIIILRGNSGSGKSSTARALQSRITPHPMLIEQDYFRRETLKEKETNDILNNELIFQAIQFAVENNRDAIVEGIFPLNHSHDKYRQLFDKVLSLNPNGVYFYYFDTPFNDTLRRHSTRPKSHEFGEEEMRRWWKYDDRSHYPNETIISSSSAIEETIDLILAQTGLRATTPSQT